MKKPLKKKSPAKKPTLLDSLVEIIRRTSTIMPDDISRAIIRNAENEMKNSIADYAMDILKENIRLAKEKSQPLCQDTGTVLFYVDCPV